jgi:glycosyltransferase 2 family protein
MTQHRWAVARLMGGAAVLVALMWRLGAEPFVAGVRATTVQAIAATLIIVAGTTVCCAWRWQLVARGLGVDVPLGEAVAAYYRSQFLNSVLPGGVLGDVHRGVSHGRTTGEMRPVLLSVAWERVVGQVVQVAAGLVVVLVLWPALDTRSSGVLTAVAAAGVCAAVVVITALSARGVLDSAAVPAVLGTSILAATGHALVFMVAADAAGVSAPTTTLLPIALVVLVAAAVPVNVAGWGPREGVAAWAFAAVGLGAATGATVAVTYGVLSLVATLPGAVLLFLRRPSPSQRADARRVGVAAHG